MFSNGSLIDGLLAFRRNVQGALKGQTECAICYSIIGTDMKTPDKRCGTCKRLFHGGCLLRWSVIPLHKQGEAQANFWLQVSFEFI